jgi:hypothetical protein
MKKTRTEQDLIRELMEWQDHRYDPGHYTGGNLHPIIKARRPNKYGYLLLFGALVIILVGVLAPTDHVLYWYYLTLQMGVALLMITAGLKLIRKPRSGSRTKRDR